MPEAGLSQPGLSQVDWTVFLRAMAEEIDASGGSAARDALLRFVGQRIATMRPITPAPDMATLAMEVNDQLAVLGWGTAAFTIDEADRSLLITHARLPRIGAAGDPPGTWLSALLEGLYEGWMAQLPGGDSALVARRVRVTPQTVVLRYGLPVAG